MTQYHYTAIIEREESGGYHAFCPALRGCHSQGETYEETVKNITETIQLYIESLKARYESTTRGASYKRESFGGHME